MTHVIPKPSTFKEKKMCYVILVFKIVYLNPKPINKILYYVIFFSRMYTCGSFEESDLRHSEAERWVYDVQGGEDPQDALSCRSFFAKEPLIIGPFRENDDKASCESSPTCSNLPNRKAFYLV